MSGQEKTEQPTPKRRQEAVDKGNLPKSNEVNSAAVMLAGLATFIMAGNAMWEILTGFMRYTYHNISFIDISRDSVPVQVILLLQVVIAILAPLLFAVLLAGILSNVFQSGIVFSRKALSPSFGKLNPLKGFKKFFSPNALVELLKGLLKLSIVSAIAYQVLENHADAYMLMVTRSTAEIVAFLFEVILEMTVKVALIMVILAVADFAYQRYSYEKGLKMTKQEVKDEAKSSEGNPQVRGKIKSRMLEVMRQRISQSVPEATVVITNPIHLAIALKYDPRQQTDAPLVVAKGKRKNAAKIKEIARENFVPIVENKPLARSLYPVCEVGQEIPEEFYQAVAEILAQIFQRDNQRLEAIRSQMNG
ncbi:MAG TPA: flagellar biosynthesis protein FlhB [Calditrichia bacterium]|nr:flagellar biosynthesis protein FlhB [Calditrichota bacterium]HQU70658.1 flagellar biosynthesis protein FlhB [Calditrichia bacterium]HQV30400.1 flagellar biosynthesis protein FlhB [Calditrichia bacterium]